VGGRELDSDSGLSLGYDWEAESDNVDVKLHHFLSDRTTRYKGSSLRSELGVSEPNWHDWAFWVAKDLEAGLGHCSSELDGVVSQFSDVAGILKEIEDFEGGTDYGWCD